MEHLILIRMTSIREAVRVQLSKYNVPINFKNTADVVPVLSYKTKEGDTFVQVARYEGTKYRLLSDLDEHISGNVNKYIHDNYIISEVAILCVFFTNDGTSLSSLQDLVMNEIGYKSKKYKKIHDVYGFTSNLINRVNKEINDSRIFISIPGEVKEIKKSGGTTIMTKTLAKNIPFSKVSVALKADVLSDESDVYNDTDDNDNDSDFSPDESCSDVSMPDDIDPDDMEVINADNIKDGKRKREDVTDKGGDEYYNTLLNKSHSKKIKKMHKKAT